MWFRRKQQSRQSLPNQQEMVRLYRSALKGGLSLDNVENQIEIHLNRLVVTETIEEEAVIDRSQRLKKSMPQYVIWGAAALPVAFIAVGLYLVSSAVLPIVKYYGSTIPALQSQQLASPIPDDQVMDATPLVITQVKAFHKEEVVDPKIINLELDYTNLANWFDATGSAEFDQIKSQLAANSGHLPAEAQEYTIDIPKINIQNAKVKVGGTDLNHSLIAYQGTALPGDAGAPVIFGHSVLRQFYNPAEKNPRRYSSIFSFIMTLKQGDPIYVTYQGVKYTYIVQSKTEVKPTDVHILGQQYDRKQLKLVTCTPEGTYLRRGVVTAQLVSSE